MIRGLRRWLWWESFPESRLRFAEAAEAPDGASYEGLAGALVGELARAEAMLKRRQAAEGAAPASERETLALMRGMLPTLDSLDRIIDYIGQAVAQNPELENWLTSLTAMRTKFLRTLEQAGLTPVNSLGSKLDLDMHEVVRTVRRAGTPPDTVVEETQKAYLYKGKLLRDARVVVSQ
ncbi:MAG: nucleotide exchange factor GrpE [Candidatus Sumerlaeia bacterium]|nr:nucleotide exchange factor GrpE [Candidatus Sumerlaeia bacterium]